MSLVNIYYMRSLVACVCAVSRKQNQPRDDDDDNLSIDRNKPIDVSKAVQVYAPAINIYTEKQQRIYCVYTHTTVCVCVCGVYSSLHRVIDRNPVRPPARRAARSASPAADEPPRKNLDICKL